MLQPTLTVIDSVSPICEEIRSAALSFEAKEVEFGGFMFPGIIREEGLEKMMCDHLCPIIASQIGRTIIPVLTFFRLGLSDHKPEIYIHADKLDNFSHAAVFYLTPDVVSEGGTAFWKHNETGLDHLPQPDRLEMAGLKWDQAFCDKINSEGRDESLWTMIGLVGAKFNRLALYPGQFFHSRYPMNYSGSTPETGRLVWVCFFKFA